MLEFITSKSKPLTPSNIYENPKNESVVLRFTEVDEAKYEDYYKSFLPEFDLYDEKCLSGNRFATLVTDAMGLHVCFYPAISEMRVIYGKRTWLPPKQAPAFERVMTPAFTQIGLSIGGMLYVVQLADGSFMIIDSGKKNDDDRDLLLNFLLEKKPAHHEKPIISAWLISHSHNDHLHLCQEFLLDYGDKVELKLFGYNFPDFESDIINSTRPAETTHAVHWQNRMKDILDEHFPDVPRYIMYTGESLLLPGCEVKVIGSWEDYWPEEMVTVNQTSFILQFVFESGKTFLLPADAWVGQTNMAVAIWGDTLKSDVLQAVHHGLAGGNIAFYEKVLPEIVFWPSPEDRFMATEPIYMPELDKKIAIVRGYKHSSWLLEHVDRHYHCGQTTTVDTETLEVI